MDEHSTQPLSDSPGHEGLHPERRDAWSVLIHNDDVTPIEFVIHTLSSVFMLSDELAEHIAATAHENGSAVVTTRHRAEAEMLMRVALGRAKSDGYPLHFTLVQS